MFLVDDHGHLINTEYDRWRELKRMVIVYGLPREDDASGRQRDSDDPMTMDNSESSDLPSQGQEECSLRGRIWKAFLGVGAQVDRKQYASLARNGPSQCDSDIRNDTFRYVGRHHGHICQTETEEVHLCALYSTFRGDPAFAKRVPEDKLARLLNVFINEVV